MPLKKRSQRPATRRRRPSGPQLAWNECASSTSRAKTLYEGTRVTQKVKKSRAWTATRHCLAAVLSLALGALGVSCSPDSSEPAGASGSGRFTACDSSGQCDEAHGFSCVNRECSYECQSHAD